MPCKTQVFKSGLMIMGLAAFGIVLGHSEQ